MAAGSAYHRAFCFSRRHRTAAAAAVSAALTPPVNLASRDSRKSLIHGFKILKNLKALHNQIRKIRALHLPDPKISSVINGKKVFHFVLQAEYFFFYIAKPGNGKSIPLFFQHNFIVLVVQQIVLIRRPPAAEGRVKAARLYILYHLYIFLVSIMSAYTGSYFPGLS